MDTIISMPMSTILIHHRSQNDSMRCFDTFSVTDTLPQLLLKLYVYRWSFFKKYFELFDGVVVVISFILDIIPAVGSTEAELIIIARLWRVARIVNGKKTKLVSS